MVMIVTLDQASEHLRRDTTDDDADLTLKIEAASKAVITFLKSGATFLDSQGDVPLDSSGIPVVPEDIKAATLVLIGILYRDRDGQEMDKWKQGYLPFTVTALLYPYRDPALA